MKCKKGSGALSFKRRYNVIIPALIILILSFAVCGCKSAVPSGQVQGILDFEEIRWRPNDLYLAVMDDEAIELNTSLHSSFVVSGEFLFEDVQPGKYCIVGFWVKDGFGYLFEEDSLVTFEILKEKGIDLGTVCVSRVEYLSSN